MDREQNAIEMEGLERMAIRQLERLIHHCVGEGTLSGTDAIAYHESLIRFSNLSHDHFVTERDASRAAQQRRVTK